MQFCLENLIFSVFFISFMIFMKIYNFSTNISARDEILLENLIIGSFSVNITERDRIPLENIPIY